MLTTILLALALLIALSLLNGIRSELIWIGAGIRRLEKHHRSPRITVSLRVDDKGRLAEHGGQVDPINLSLAMNDRQFATLEIPGPFVDMDGQPFKNAGGEPFIPDASWITSDETIAPIEMELGGLKLKIKSGLVGVAQVVGEIGPFPGGGAVTITVNVGIGNSAPGPFAVNLSEPQDEVA